MKAEFEDESKHRGSEHVDVILELVHKLVLAVLQECCHFWAGKLNFSVPEVFLLLNRLIRELGVILRKSEIYNYRIVIVQHDVFWGQVIVSDLFRMRVAHT